MGVVLTIRCEKNLHCQGCGTVRRWIDKKSLLCLWCLALRLDAEDRKAQVSANLNATVRQKFAVIGNEVREKLAEFARI